MSLPELCLIFFSILASVAGQFFLKTGALKLGRLSTTNIVSHVLNILFTPELILGLTCYAIGAIVYILLLTRVELSVAAPAVSLVYVFSVLLGYFLFKEPIPISRAFGLGLIICGVIFITWKQ